MCPVEFGKLTKHGTLLEHDLLRCRGGLLVDVGLGGFVVNGRADRE